MSYVTGYVNVVKRDKENGYNITSTRTSDKYLKSALSFLDKNIDLIVFIEPDMVEEVRNARAMYGFLDKTVIIPFEIIDSPYYKYYEQLDRIWKQGGNPYPDMQISTPLYLITIWTKFYWMKLAAEMSSSKSHQPGDCASNLCWIDFGLANDFPISMDYGRLLDGAPDNAIKIARTKNSYHYDHHTAYKEHYRSILASLMLGTCETWNKISYIFEDEVAFAMQHDYPVYEETILTWMEVKGHVVSHLVRTHICSALFTDTICDWDPILIINESKILRDKKQYLQGYRCVHQLYSNWMVGHISLPIDILIHVMDEIIINGYYAGQRDTIKKVGLHLQQISKHHTVAEYVLMNMKFAIN